MNPSASGWIEKFGYLAESQPPLFENFGALYQELRSLGFAYGMSVAVPDFIVPAHKLTKDEKAKLNLLFGLYYTYQLHKGEVKFDYFTKAVFLFYNELEVGRISFLEKVLSGKKTSSQLEKLMDSRIHLDANVLTRTFNSLLTNTMLFVDVLTFKYYLEGSPDPRKFARNLEYMIINIAYQALSSRNSHPSDEKLRELFQASLTFTEVPVKEVDMRYREMLASYKGADAAPYFLDVACLAVWEDAELEGSESKFVRDLGAELELGEAFVQKTLAEVTAFLTQNATVLGVFEKDRFYDGMSAVVSKLIRRNSKRLQKELSQSRELVYLLSKSTVKELSEAERKKIQDQLLDVFKSVPSLAIFMLPGGAVLLPIFIKLVPKLLPSSFDENRVEPPPK